jgi:hypothetical protein
MGLRTNKTVVPQEETTVNQEPETKKEETMPETPAVETKEVAVKPPAEVPTVAGERVAPSLTSLENKLNPEEFGNLFPRIVGSNGAACVSGTGGVNFGRFIDVQVLSLSDRWMVTPDADQKDKEAKKFCRASYDGKTILDREGNSQTIEDYITSVDKYEFNATSKYRDIFAVIFSAEKEVEKAKALGIVQISISPTAMKQLKAFTMQTPLFIMRGQMAKTHQDCLRIAAEPKTNDSGNNYTIFDFQCVPMDVIAGYTPVSM